MRIFLKKHLIVVGLFFCVMNALGAYRPPSGEDLRRTQMGLSRDGKRIDPKEASRQERNIVSAFKGLGVKKTSHFATSVSGMSGARWVQEHMGVTGRGIWVGVLEKEEGQQGRRPLETMVIIPQEDTQRFDLRAIPQDHPRGVIAVLEQVAPGCHVVLGTSGKGGIVFDEEIMNTRLLNMSLGFDPKDAPSFPEFSSQIKKMAKDLNVIMKMGQPKLLIKSAGNEGHNLSRPYTRAGDQTFSDVALLMEDPDIQSSMIIAGNMTSLYVPAEGREGSNFPGDNPVIQNSFLWTLGSDVKIWTVYPVFTADGLMDSVSGTSSAAPVVTGCVALLLEKYSDLPPEKIKEAFLWSAYRSFMARHPRKDKKWDATFVVDPEDYLTDEARSSYVRSIQRAWDREKKRENSTHGDLTIRDFDPSIDGMGILNVRRAFAYAALFKLYPNEEPSKLRARMKGLEKINQKHSATILQRAFRKKPT